MTRPAPALEPWSIDPAAFPADGSPAEQLRFLVRYAVLAPSSHNTQPWLFRIEADTLALFADRTRALPVVDPNDRALVISCGAALASLEVAAERFGVALGIELLPEGVAADLLARVVWSGRVAQTVNAEALCDAIARRRTNRRAFEPEPLPEGLRHAACAIANTFGVELHWIVEPAAKRILAALVAEGDRAQLADPSFRRELAAWIHSRRATSRDGMSGYAFGMPDLLSPVGALVIRTFDVGAGQAAKDEELASGSPALAVFATAGDEPGDWLATGRALQRALLTLTAAGFTASYLNQPIEVAALRPRLARAAGIDGFPQLLVRAGRGPELLPAARRALDDVLLP